MFDTADEILRQLRAGEDSRAEFKELRFGERGVISPNTEDFAAEMVAFANGVGGTLFMSVDDAGSAVLPSEKQGGRAVGAELRDPQLRPSDSAGNQAASATGPDEWSLT